MSPEVFGGGEMVIREIRQWRDDEIDTTQSKTLTFWKFQRQCMLIFIDCERWVMFGGKRMHSCKDIPCSDLSK